MGRRLKVDRPIMVRAQVPTSIWSLVQSQLYSEIEGKIPFGATSQLIEGLLTEWLRNRGVIQ